jgi:hypothetical protein
VRDAAVLLHEDLTGDSQGQKQRMPAGFCLDLGADACARQIGRGMRQGGHRHDDRQRRDLARRGRL